MVVSNTAGAAGAVGDQFAATSKPDGYTLLIALVSVSLLPEVDKLLGRPPRPLVSRTLDWRARIPVERKPR